MCLGGPSRTHLGTQAHSLQLVKGDQKGAGDDKGEQQEGRAEGA